MTQPTKKHASGGRLTIGLLLILGLIAGSSALVLAGHACAERAFTRRPHLAGDSQQRRRLLVYS